MSAQFSFAQLRRLAILIASTTLVASCASTNEQLASAISQRDAATVVRLATTPGNGKVAAELLQARVRTGDIVAVRMLLDADADKAIERGFTTPLMYAALYGHVEIARLLLDRGANVNEQNDSLLLRSLPCSTPSSSAQGTLMNLGKINLGPDAFAGTTSCYRLEEANGSGNCALSYSIVKKNPAMVALLLERGARKDLTVIRGDPEFALVDVLSNAGRGMVLRSNYELRARTNNGQDIFFRNIEGFVTTNSTVGPQKIVSLRDLAMESGSSEIATMLRD